MPLSGPLYSHPYVGLAMHMPRRLLPGNNERDKIVVVAEKKAFETTQKLNEFWYTTSQAIVQSTFEVQGRSLQYVQNTFQDGIETLKSNIDASQHWLQMATKTQDQQAPIPSLMESSIEAYKRNVSFLQRTIEHGAETFRSNTEVMHNLAQTLIKKTQEQLETSWS